MLCLQLGSCARHVMALYNTIVAWHVVRTWHRTLLMFVTGLLGLVFGGEFALLQKAQT